MGKNKKDKKLYIDTYDDIISVENLLLAFRELRRGKKHKKDVEEFGHRLMENILLLYQELKDKKYVHGNAHKLQNYIKERSTTFSSDK